MSRNEVRWVLCPACGNKTRTKVRYDTELENFLLFCPKCKQETIISLIKQVSNIAVPLLVGVANQPQAKGGLCVL